MSFIISDDDQLRMTKEEIGKFQVALVQLEQDKAGLHPNYFLAMRGALESQMEDLEEQVWIYESAVARRSRR